MSRPSRGHAAENRRLSRILGRLMAERGFSAHFGFCTRPGKGEEVRIELDLSFPPHINDRVILGDVLLFKAYSSGAGALEFHEERVRRSFGS